jgi:hypothetical protein
MNNVDSRLTVSFSLHADFFESFKEMNTLFELVQDTYNTLIIDYCDPLFRRIEVLELSNYEGPARDGCAKFELTFFDVLGHCRGCGDDTPMLDDEGKNRKKSTRKASEASLSSLSTITSSSATAQRYRLLLLRQEDHS